MPTHDDDGATTASYSPKTRANRRASARASSRYPLFACSCPQHVCSRGNTTSCPSRSSTSTTAFPVCGKSVSPSQLQWIADSYMLVFAGILLTAGSLGDRFGRRRALVLGLVIFGAGSLASAFAGSATELIATRGLMGLGAAFIMPSTLSILTN